MYELFGAPPALLPDWLLHVNLLRCFIWYISIIFAVGMLLRLRFYWSLYDVADHVSRSCPSVFELVHGHWFVCVKDGIILRVGLYVAVLTVYLALNYLVYPLASINLLQLAADSPALLAFHLVLVGVMVTVDTVLMAQVSVIDADAIKQELTYADGWLGGNVNHFLQFLGKWNPIQKFADAKARQNLQLLNEVFRNSLALLTVQLVLRITCALALFMTAVAWT